MFENLPDPPPEPESLATEQPLSRTAEAERITDWRLLQCLRLGLPSVLARRFAALRWHEGDLHELAQLIGRGCPPTLAARISAAGPIDG